MTRRDAHPAANADADAARLTRLRARDPEAFAALIDAESPVMLGLARSIVGAEAAEEVVQNAWLAAFKSIESFEGRASLRTWLGQIVLNGARTLARHRARTVPLSSAVADADASDDPSGEIDRLVDRQGHWHAPAAHWADAPDARLYRSEVRDALEAEIAKLPEIQRLIVVLRDVQGVSSEETCHILGVSESNQRQLLHRARLRLRRALEEFRP